MRSPHYTISHHTTSPPPYRRHTSPPELRNVPATRPSFLTSAPSYCTARCPVQPHPSHCTYLPLHCMLRDQPFSLRRRQDHVTSSGAGACRASAWHLGDGCHLRWGGCDQGAHPRTAHSALQHGRCAHKPHGRGEGELKSAEEGRGEGKTGHVAWDGQEQQKGNER